MSWEDNSTFTDPEVPLTLPPEPAESANVVSVEAALQIIHGWQESTRSAYSSDGAEALRQSTVPIASRPLSRAISDRIPFEVVELIMGWMSQASLGTCAQVCQAWHQASVGLLYQKITIASRTAFDALVDFASKDARASERLVETSLLRIGGHPRHRDAPVHVIPVVFTRMMPGVRTLVFYLSQQRLLHSTFFRTLHLFRAVTTLELFSFVLDSFGELRSIICAFPQLSCLKLAVGTLRAETPSTPIRSTPIRLDRLVLGWGLASLLIVPLVEWLSESLACTNLAHLAIWRTPYNLRSPVNRLLKVAGQSLLSMYDFNDNDFSETSALLRSLSRRPGAQGMRSPLDPGQWFAQSSVSHYTLAHSRSLRSVRLELQDCVLDDRPDDKSRWVSIALALESILRTVRSPNLQSIRIHQRLLLTQSFFPLSDRPRLFFANLEEDALLSVHDAMKRPVFGNLTSVELSFDMDYSAWKFSQSKITVATAAQTFLSGVSHLFAPWCERGLVTVVQKENPIYSETNDW